MIVRNNCDVPGLEEISSDDYSDDDIRFIDVSSRQIKNYEAITIDDSLTEDDEIIVLKIDDKRKHINEVWRNIIECDLLDQSLKNLGLNKLFVNREIESYELPSYKLRRHKKSKTCGVKQRLGKRSKFFSKKDIIHLSSSDDEPKQYKRTNVRERLTMPETIIIEDECEDEEDRDHVEIIDTVSESDSEEEEQERNTWNKLIRHLDQDQFQMEFENGRQATARRIATDLKEPKVDLIERCLLYLGLEKCQTFVAATKRIEESGGMPTKDGSRRRTPGGVFLTLIKSDRTIDHTIKEQIFLDTEDTPNEAESLWWKSVEISQYRRNNRRKSRPGPVYSRRKEFKSYTLIDLDYFECFKDFRYRYVPMMTNFSMNEMVQSPGGSGDCKGDEIYIDDSTDNGDDDDDDDVIELDPTETKRLPPPSLSTLGQHLQTALFEMGGN